MLQTGTAHLSQAIDLTSHSRSNVHVVSGDLFWALDTGKVVLALKPVKTAEARKYDNNTRKKNETN